MAFVRGCGSDVSQKFLEILQNDLKNLSIETKKKYPQIKEVGDTLSVYYVSLFCE